MDSDRDIFGKRAFDFADETQRQVQLPIVLPARAGDSAHKGKQLRADARRRAETDEQAMHGLALTIIVGAAHRFCLKMARSGTIFGTNRQFAGKGVHNGGLV